MDRRLPWPHRTRRYVRREGSSPWWFAIWQTGNKVDYETSWLEVSAFLVWNWPEQTQTIDLSDSDSPPLAQLFCGICKSREEPPTVMR